jgi:hypothetical protein
MATFNVKVLFLLSILALLFFVYMTVTINRHSFKFVPFKISLLSVDHDVSTKLNDISKIEQQTEAPAVNLKMKYILQWTSPRSVPFVYMGEGQEGFTSRKCPYTNCFVTSNRNLLGDVTKFDVIAFSGPEVRFYKSNQLPNARSPHQKYVFATIESSHYYPVCNTQFNNFFNWTWTFRLDSDVRWGYILIRDQDNKIVGPNKIMHWLKLEEMMPVTKEYKTKLKTKTKAAAWFVSVLDIYGKCGSLQCPTKDITDCEKMLSEDYYFYLSFENSYSEDYVTEKLIKALQNDVIPIVYGGANYTRYKQLIFLVMDIASIPVIGDNNWPQKILILKLYQSMLL